MAFFCHRGETVFSFDVKELHLNEKCDKKKLFFQFPEREVMYFFFFFFFACLHFFCH